MAGLARSGAGGRERSGCLGLRGATHGCGAGDRWPLFLERRLLERMPALGSSPWPSGDALLLLAAPAALPLIETMATAAGAELCWQRPQWPRGLLLRELCWNHTTLQVRANAPEFTYQLVLLPDPVGPFIEAIAERWPGWVHWHLERVRQGGRLRWVGLLPFQWRGETALAELNGALKAAGGWSLTPMPSPWKTAVWVWWMPIRWPPNGPMTQPGSAIQASCGAGAQGQSRLRRVSPLALRQRVI